MEPNEFFGGGLNESGAAYGGLDDGESLVRSVDFGPNNYPASLDHGFVAEEYSEEEAFDPMLNIAEPDFTTRLRLYLKPDKGNLKMHLLLLLSDTVLAITYISSQLSYVIAGHYLDNQDKLV